MMMLVNLCLTHGMFSDDFEDIWPKDRRLSFNLLDKLIVWQPVFHLSPMDDINGDEDSDLSVQRDLSPIPGILQDGKYNTVLRFHSFI